jgi:hypothetical protein
MNKEWHRRVKRGNCHGPDLAISFFDSATNKSQERSPRAFNNLKIYIYHQCQNLEIGEKNNVVLKDTEYWEYCIKFVY